MKAKMTTTTPRSVDGRRDRLGHHRRCRFPESWSCRILRSKAGPQPGRGVATGRAVSTAQDRGCVVAKATRSGTKAAAAGHSPGPWQLLVQQLLLWRPRRDQKNDNEKDGEVLVFATMIPSTEATFGRVTGRFRGARKAVTGSAAVGRRRLSCFRQCMPDASVVPVVAWKRREELPSCYLFTMVTQPARRW